MVTKVKTFGREVRRRRKVDPVERFLSKVSKKRSGCWIWTASIRLEGYGQFHLNERNRLAHRVAYEFFVGRIPDGLQLDHLCRNRACVNPKHLEPVTPRENVMRGTLPEASRRRGRERTHCRNGHPFIGDNVARGPDNERVCRACNRIKARRCRPTPSQQRRRGPRRLVLNRDANFLYLDCGHMMPVVNNHQRPSTICSDCEVVLPEPED